jgi:hypothetical protein
MNQLGRASSCLASWQVAPEPSGAIGSRMTIPPNGLADFEPLILTVVNTMD